MNSTADAVQLDEQHLRYIDAIQLDEQDLANIEAAIKAVDRPIEDEHKLKMGVVK